MQYSSKTEMLFISSEGTASITLLSNIQKCFFFLFFNYYILLLRVNSAHQSFTALLEKVLWYHNEAATHSSQQVGWLNTSTLNMHTVLYQRSTNKAVL